ncbi:hypothetical protein ScPMuIL_006271 [Solemya velum]
MIIILLNNFFSSFITTPKLAEDMISTSTDFSHYLVAVSLGYFLFDIMDMLLYQRNKQSYELLGHHFVIASCFTIAVSTRVWIGYACVALIFELNSIFLHIRMLLTICGFKKTDKTYRLNSLINIGTFIAFRMLTLAWMTRWIVANKKFVPLIFYIIGCLSVATMIVMNIILFYRCLCTDFFRKKDSAKKESLKHSE